MYRALNTTYRLSKRWVYGKDATDFILLEIQVQRKTRRNSFVILIIEYGVRNLLEQPLRPVHLNNRCNFKSLDSRSFLTELAIKFQRILFNQELPICDIVDPNDRRSATFTKIEVDGVAGQLPLNSILAAISKIMYLHIILKNFPMP
ncbi:903_t:CDS:2 [Paraglomus occultum]|uniref:903_t:CDS:1 n=1 Tax=Paraglomus occultum TaxID=144539 RepID=A0A9N8W3G0_9GLOM|nr:903_t:CDS:2 [Paraglomus occultum]